ncbi:RNA processing factor [Lithospermum erythrorhizon]|uniref:RNA processing factor n=1 Tax=Lithospermum erythrorhizon TaxID=34254 RepID=A0AAV3QSQ2_LITER
MGGMRGSMMFHLRRLSGKKEEGWYRLPEFRLSIDGASVGKAIANSNNITTNPSAIKWVFRCCPELPTSLVHKLFRLRQVRKQSCHFHLDNPKLNRVAAKDSLEVGDRIFLPISVQKILPLEPKVLVFNDEEMKFIRSLLLYKDSAVIVINKPPGLPVQGGIGIKKSIDNLATKYLKYEYQDSPRLVHRLDRDCSGVLVMGRTQLTASALHSIFREKTSALSNGDINHKKQIIQKKYWALVIGSPRRDKGLISAPLGKVIVGDGKSELIQIRDNIESSGAQYAVTEYRVIGSSNHGFTWLELCPLTGRKHQLRVHCAEFLGTPIVGDFKYGWQAHRNLEHLSCIARSVSQQDKSPKPVIDPFDLDLESGSLSDKQWRLHLHCKEMVLPNIHATLQHAKMITDCSFEELKFEAPLPSHMQQSWDIFHS